jgi:hypothetical protein
MRSTWLALLLSSAVAATGCGDDDDGGDDPSDGTIDGGPGIDAPPAAECDIAGEPSAQYINNKVTIKETKPGAFDLDGDTRPDNALGPVIALLETRGLTIQMTVDEAIAAGSLVMLHSVKGDLAASDPASWSVYLGEPFEAPPVFDGSDQATVASSSPDDAKLCGKVTGGRFAGGPGAVTVQLALGEGAPLEVKLIGVRLEAAITADGCTDGLLGGGVTGQELDTNVYPAIAELLNNTTKDDHPAGAESPQACVAANDPCPPTHRSTEADPEPTVCDVERKLCLQSSTIQTLEILDKNNDAMVTPEEIKTNKLIAQALNLDVDLQFGDGEADSLSVALEFECAKATFTE